MWEHHQKAISWAEVHYILIKSHQIFCRYSVTPAVVTTEADESGKWSGCSDLSFHK